MPNEVTECRLDRELRVLGVVQTIAYRRVRDAPRVSCNRVTRKGLSLQAVSGADKEDSAYVANASELPTIKPRQLNPPPSFSMRSQLRPYSEASAIPAAAAGEPLHQCFAVCNSATSLFHQNNDINGVDWISGRQACYWTHWGSKVMARRS